MATQITYNTRHVLESAQARAHAVLVYNHIPKCGGLSLTHRLRQCYPASCDVHQNLFEPRATPLDKDFYHGHGVSGIEHYLAQEKQYFYITVLRHPWSLAQSLVRFFQWLTPLDAFYQQEPEKLLLLQQPNILIHYLGNGDAELAEENLLQNYVFFGLQEYFSASMDLLSQTIPEFAQTEHIAKNVSSKEPWHISDSVKEEFFARNAQDIALYAKAKAEFLRRAGIEEHSAKQAKKQSADLVSSNTQGSNLESIYALKESVALNEDLPGMDAAQARFENWLHILVHSMQSEAEYIQLFQWLVQRTKKRISCLYFAYVCAKKSQSPVLEAKLPTYIQLLFNLCMQRDPDNACRLMVECRLELIEYWVEHKLMETQKHFDYSSFVWLIMLEKQKAWREKAKILQKELEKQASPLTKMMMHGFVNKVKKA